MSQRVGEQEFSHKPICHPESEPSCHTGTGHMSYSPRKHTGSQNSADHIYRQELTTPWGQPLLTYTQVEYTRETCHSRIFWKVAWPLFIIFDIILKAHWEILQESGWGEPDKLGAGHKCLSSPSVANCELGYGRRL